MRSLDEIKTDRKKELWLGIASIGIMVILLAYITAMLL
jgi:hypothetical protein